MKFIVNTDGASRGNPGPASYGFVIKNVKGEILYKEGKTIGVTTNNVAEYMAVLRGIEHIINTLSKSKDDLVEIITDSLLIASQLSGRFKIKNERLMDLYFQIKGLEQHFSEISYRNVPREQNKQADNMANLALDGKILNQLHLKD